jgi:subtilisin-like proprotein convertase family protein
MKQLRVIALLALALLIAACSGGGSSQQANDPGGAGTAPPPDPEVAVQLPDSAITQMKALTAEKAARTPAQRKISSQLLYAKSDRFPALRKTLRKGETPKPTELRSLMQFDDQGRVLCDVKGDVDGGLATQIELAGGTVVMSSAAHRAARAWLPLESLEALAGQPIVTAIRPAFSARTNRANVPYATRKFPQLTQEQRVANMQKALRALSEAPSSNAIAPAATNAGSVTSEGSRAQGADRARKFYNTDGTGVKVGVLSDSDDFKEQSIASGDLPADTVTVPGQDGRPGSGEGTAMMEIVHDVAPGAKIFFASAFNSPESFADNIRTLRFVYHCDVIVDDVQYYFESPFQDDIVAAAIADVTADGALYFSSAGNGGNFDDGTSGTFEGDFKSAGALASIDEFDPTKSFYRVLDFGKKVVSNRIELIGGPIVLHWADPGSLDNPQSSNDYDVFVLSSDLRDVIVASTDVQDGDDLPFEFLGFLVPSEFRVVVAATPTAAVRAVRLQIFDGELGIGTGGSVGGHAGSASAFAVGAVDAANAGGGEFTAGPFTPVEIFSSDGNRMQFYDRNGNKIGSGNPTFAGSAGVTIKKPDASAADGVSTTLPSSSGLNPFFGTSAAAPHAGAIAALIKSAVPTADATKIANALKNGALDIEASSFDVDSGNGLISAMNGLQRAGAKPNVFLDRGTVTATPTSGTVIKPGTSATMTVDLINNGGATASAISATLSTSSPGVTITSANSTYATMAPGTTRTNTTPFAFNLSPAALCGLKVDFTLSVTYTGLGTKPTVLQFSVQTGGAGSPLLTSYSGAVVPIPDNSAAGVDIPLTVSGAGLLSALSFQIDGTTCSSAVGATTVGVNHTWVGDLRFHLTSPGGTTVEVINRAGGTGNSGNNFCQTVLRDDAANSIQTVAIAAAPFTGTFAPANPQSVFAGENADGTWILNVSDNASIDTGSVRAFSLETTGFSCTP